MFDLNGFGNMIPVTAPPATVAPPASGKFTDAGRMFGAEALSRLSEGFPGRPVAFRHLVADEPALAHSALVGLSGEIAEDRRMYNRADIALDHDQQNLPPNGLGYTQTVQEIAQNRSWACLRNVERHEPYRSLLNVGYDDIAPLVTARVGPIFRKESDIFVSSPHAVTPLHIDPQHNILMQISGRKRVVVFDPALVAPEAHEIYHCTGHSGLKLEPRFEGQGAAFDLGPGDALFIPVKAPHHVTVGSTPSISISLMWRSAGCDRERRIYRVNAMLRRAGLNPGLAGAHPARDSLKAAAFRTVELAQRIIPAR